METNVIPDNVEIHAGAKDTVAICNGCGASYEDPLICFKNDAF